MRKFPLIGALAVVLSGYSQNLVPNPSFEQVSACPSFASQLELAAPWVNPNGGTPELYHACAPPASYASVPDNNTGGHQYAHGGVAYAGIYTWRTDIPNMREYVQVALSSPMEAGTCYRVTFYVNMPNDHPYACDGIGALLSVGPATGNDGQLLAATPQVANPSGNLITDTLGWTEVTGVYSATGGETHLTIGNFNNDASTQTTVVNTGVWYQTSAYLLLDDVSVEPIELSVDLGPDTLLCAGDALTLDAMVPGADYLWCDGSTNPTLTADQAGEYWVRVSAGDCIASDSILIGTMALPRLDLPREIMLCTGADTLLDASAPGATVRLADGDTSSLRRISTPGVYTAVATNACGSATATTEVLSGICPCMPFMPNAFTPNGDGINDRAGPLFVCPGGRISWALFDRWGHEAHRGDGTDAQWDGRVDGHPAREGLYTWQISVQHPEGRTSMHTGHLLLLR